MSRVLLALSGFLALVLGAGLIAWFLWISYLTGPTVRAGGRPVEARLELAAGISASEVLERLAAKGLVARPAWLRIYIETLKAPLVVAAGEYTLSNAMSPREIIEKLDRGQVVTYPFTIEPATTARVLFAKLAEEGFGDPARLLALSRDPKFVHELGISANTLEGYFVPDTYNLPRGLKAENLLALLVAGSGHLLNPALLAAGRALGFDSAEVVILASMLEVESVDLEEKDSAVAVLENRLRRHLPLASLATLAYGLGKDPKALSPADLEADTPYNTFIREGLPPTPICAPSPTSLFAVTHPPKSDAIAFAPRSDTTHVFCPDDECYRAAMERFRAFKQGLGEPFPVIDRFGLLAKARPKSVR